MRNYTSAAQEIAFSSSTNSPPMNSSPVSTTNTVAANPLLSHALKTAGTTNHSLEPTTSSKSENINSRKRSAEDEIIQVSYRNHEVRY